MSKTKKKLCFSASSGGHFEQILMLKPLMDQYDSFIMTEKTAYTTPVENQKIYYLHQTNRKKWDFPIDMLKNAWISLRAFLKERPDVVITTGVMASIPIGLLAKMFGKKLIYIESFAMVDAPTRTGKLMYRFADQFYVQWPQMKSVYPNAIYLGGIY